MYENIDTDADVDATQDVTMEMDISSLLLDTNTPASINLSTNATTNQIIFDRHNRATTNSNSENSNQNQYQNQNSNQLLMRRTSQCYSLSRIQSKP